MQQLTPDYLQIAGAHLLAAIEVHVQSVYDP